MNILELLQKLAKKTSGLVCQQELGLAVGFSVSTAAIPNSRTAIPAPPSPLLSREPLAKNSRVQKLYRLLDWGFVRP